MLDRLHFCFGGYQFGSIDHCGKMPRIAVSIGALGECSSDSRAYPVITSWIPGSNTLIKKTNKDSDVLQAEVFERQARICKAFANSTRLRLLDLLGKREGASELQKQLGISKANLSQHVAILKAACIVASRRDGKSIHFSLTMPEVKNACQLIRDVLRTQIREDRRLSV